LLSVTADSIAEKIATNATIIVRLFNTCEIAVR